MTTHRLVVRARLGLASAPCSDVALLVHLRELGAVRGVAVLDRLSGRRREHEHRVRGQLSVAGQAALVVRVVAAPTPVPAPVARGVGHVGVADAGGGWGGYGGVCDGPRLVVERSSEGRSATKLYSVVSICARHRREEGKAYFVALGRHGECLGVLKAESVSGVCKWGAGEPETGFLWASVKVKDALAGPGFTKVLATARFVPATVASMTLSVATPFCRPRL